MTKGILGRKVGMTQVFDPETGVATPVTVIEAGPCKVLQLRTTEKDLTGHSMSHPKSFLSDWI